MKRVGIFPGWIGKIPIALPMAVAWLPIVIWYVRRLDDGSDEPLGLLAFAVALLLAWREKRSLFSGSRARVIGALGLLASVATTGILPPLPRAALAIAGTGAWFGLHRKPGIMALLILSLPVVASLQFYLGYPMRLAAAAGTAELLETAGLVVVRNGVDIGIGGAAVSVDPACSGIRMLWHALAAAMGLAAIHRLSWRATAAAGLLALALVIPANLARAAWLALIETGRFHAMAPGHESTGLLCFGLLLVPLWWFASARALPERVLEKPAVSDNGARMILYVAALLLPWSGFHSADPKNRAAPMAPPESFTFNHLTLSLQPLPASAAENAFANTFPGSLSSHRWGGHQVILRRVTQATRKLHPSRDCLRAAGFETTDAVTVRCSDGFEWSRFSATRNGGRFTVHERIVSERDGGSWTDVTAWYWSALFHPLNGPWRAETVISP